MDEETIFLALCRQCACAYESVTYISTTWESCEDCGKTANGRYEVEV